MLFHYTHALGFVSLLLHAARGLPGVPGQTVPSSVLGTYLWLLFSHLRGKGGAVAAAAVGQVGTGLV